MGARNGASTYTVANADEVADINNPAWLVREGGSGSGSHDGSRARAVDGLLEVRLHGGCQLLLLVSLLRARHCVVVVVGGVLLMVDAAGACVLLIACSGRCFSGEGFRRLVV